jgi:transcriptional regulator with XRE-family HTH domain
MSLSERIKLIKGSLSQDQFGKMIGASQGAVKSWEAGDSAPGSAFLSAIRAKFGVNIDWLLTGEGEQYIDKREKKGIEIKPVIEEQPDISIDSFAKAVSQLKEIFDCQDYGIITAIQANLNTVVKTVRREKELSNLIKENEQLKAKTSSLEDRVSSLEAQLSRYLADREASRVDKEALGRQIEDIIEAKEKIDEPEALSGEGKKTS